MRMCACLQVLDRLLHRLQAKGHRVVLFSQFSKMLDILEDYIRLRDWKYKRLDGSTNRIQRMIDIQQFNKVRSRTLSAAVRAGTHTCMRVCSQSLRAPDRGALHSEG